MRHHYWVNETAGKQFVTLQCIQKFESIKERLKQFVLTVLERTMFLRYSGTKFFKLPILLWHSSVRRCLTVFC